MYRKFLLALCIPLCGVLHAQGLNDEPMVLITNDHDLTSTLRSARNMQTKGSNVWMVAAPGCIIARGDAIARQIIAREPSVLQVFSGRIDERTLTSSLPAHVPALQWLDDITSGLLDQRSNAVPMDWDHTAGNDMLSRPPPTSSGPTQGGRSHGGNAAADWTCGISYNSEKMVGVVVASTFFVESNGAIDANEFTWTVSDINSVKSQIIDAWSIWSYTANLNGSSVIAIMDWYEPAGGLSVQGYEPIRHASYQDNLWISAIMNNLGYTTQSGQFSKLDAFNHDSRSAYGAESAFSCFIAYNPPAAGAPNAMTDGKIGYAYLGGPYTQILFKANGWSTTQVNRVYGHEVGHIFHAFDEYSSSTASNCTRSFNGETNLNYHGSTCNGTMNCVMVDNSFQGSGASRSWTMCGHTPFHLGWSGTVLPATLTAPINDSIVTMDPVTLRWDRNGAPSNVIGYAKVFDRATGEEVYCTGVGMLTELPLTLVNGQYDWTIALGNGSDASGYAGMNSTTGQFILNAPLKADFNVHPATVCIGVPVYATDASSGAPSSWNWSFPGGVPSNFSGQFPPSVNYSVAGSYDVSLTVGDGTTNNSFTIPNAITVTGGLALDHIQDFNGGTFPPSDWTLGGNGGTGGNGLVWEADPISGCSYGVSAFVDSYSFTGQYGSAVLQSPRYDLTQGTAPYLSFDVSYAAPDASGSDLFTMIAKDCNFTFYTTIWEKSGVELSTNGGAYQASPIWIPQDCEDWRSEIVALGDLPAGLVSIDLRVISQGPGQAVYVDNLKMYEGSPIRLRVYLDGPFEVSTGMMKDDLRLASVLPPIEPYTALGYVYIGEGGPAAMTADLNVIGPNAIVDWVVLEVRSALDPSRILTSRAALLQRDGDIVDLDGSSIPFVGVQPGNYHLAVRHRNHLVIMTGLPVQLAAGGPLVDLTDVTTTTWGTQSRDVHDGVGLMWVGDVTFDDRVQYTGLGNDRDPILSVIGGSVPTNVIFGYLSEDCNLDGVIKYTGVGNDRDQVLRTIGGSVPTAIRHSQLP